MQSIRPFQKAKRPANFPHSASKNATAPNQGKLKPIRGSAEIRTRSQTTTSVKTATRKYRLRRNEEGANDALNVLHVGCGPKSPSRLHSIFKSGDWQEIRCDIDSSTAPDIVASIVDMSRWVDDESCDAIWASHVLEHLSRQEVPIALAEFRRVLAPSGVALIRTPDIETVAQFIVEGRIADVIYTSPAGPITPMDMLYGHNDSIARGNHAMRHGTAFTQDLLGEELLAAGFAEVRTTRTKTYEVWAAAFMPEADVDGVIDQLSESGIDLRY